MLCLGLLLGSVPAEAGFGEDETGRLWRSGPFVASAEELLAAAAADTENSEAPAVMLFQGVHYRFAADGRLEIRRHWIYRVLDAAALGDWSVSQMRWSPWHQERPRIKARVVRADGEQWLDESVLEERHAVESADGLQGGRLLLSGRLPGVEPGAVVEEEITLKELRPAFPWGTAHRHYTALFIPTVRGQVVLDASTRLALRHGVRRMPGLRPSSSAVEGDRVRVVFDLHDLPAAKAAEEGLPSHLPRYPHIAFSTGRSWNWVATGLGQLFEKVITRTRLDALASELPSASVPLQERLDQVLALIRRKVQYNGLEINASPMTPDPDRVLESGSGDGFDIALTMVAAFRRMGLDSQAALINSGFGVDVEPRLPGFGLFNHALVRVQPAVGAEPIWIDPIAPFSRPGELPLAAQGRFALLVGPGTEKLVQTPVSQPEDNRAFEEREVFFNDFGPGRIVETCEYRGSAERSQRRITEGLDDEARRRGYQAYVHAFHHAAALGNLEETEARDLSMPFRLKLEVLQSHRARTELQEAVLEIPVRELARRMPAALLDASSEPRREDYVFPEPFITEWRYVVHPPAGFELSELPSDLDFDLGPARYSRRFERRDDGVLVGHLRFDVGQRLLAAGQFEAMKKALVEHLQRPPLVLRFESVAARGLRDGDYRSAFRELERAVEAQPTNAGRRIRLALALLDIGLAHEAERQARQAVALAPRWGMAHWALAVALQHDDLGRRFSDAAPLSAALESLEEAIRLAPGDPTIRAALPRLLNRSVDGRPGPEARVDEAISTYKKWRRDFKRPDLDEELSRLLFSQGKWDEAVEFLAEVDPDSASYRVAGALATKQPPAASGAPGGTVVPVGSEVLDLLRHRAYSAAAQALRDSGSRVLEIPEGLGRLEDRDLHPQDPLTPIWRWIASWNEDGTASSDFLHPRVAAGARVEPQLRAELDALLPDGLLPDAETEKALDPRLRADWVAARLDPQLAGAPHLGYRVSLGDSPQSVIFLTAMGDRLRIAAFGHNPALLGMEALYRLDQGDLPGARRWLRWAFEASETEPSSDPLGFEPIRHLWPSGKEEEIDRRALRILAAAQAAPVDRSGVSLEALTGADVAELGPPREGEDRRALALELARLSAYSSSGAFVELGSAAADLAERYPSSAKVFRLQVEAWTALGEWETFETEVARRHEQYPGDLDAHRASAHWALRQPDLAAASKHFSHLYQAGDLTSGDAGAWIFALLAGENPQLEKAVEVLQATREKGLEDPLWLRADSLVAAENGRARQAWQALLKAVERQGVRSLTVEDGFLVGKIAEGAGLSTVAYERYSHLLSNRDLKTRSPLVFQLVEQSLARLRARL